MDFMNTMRGRHSVRRYTDAPIEGEALTRLEAAIEAANREGGLHIQLVRDEPGAFSGLLAHYGKFDGVRNYLALVGPSLPTLDRTMGYHAERIVLEAQDAGLNTCWVGGTFNRRKARYDVAPGEKLVCVIAIGYGAEQGRPHRSKALEKLCDLGGREMPSWFSDGMEGALLAPTAMNQQHFRFSLKEDGDVVARSTGGPFSEVDLGIVAYHFEMASGRNVTMQ